MSSNQPSPQSVVKSTGRTLAILELFQTWQRPASAKEIARALVMPRSSTNALLSSLVALDYLLFESDTNRYYPTLKVGLLGDWMIGSVRGDQVLNNILRDINSDTGETATIAVRSGFDMQFITIIPSSFPIALNIAEGALAGLFDSAVGIAWFSGQDLSEVDRLSLAYNKQNPERPVDPKAIHVQVLEARDRGAAVAYEKVLPDTGAIATAYPRPLQGQTVVIGVGGPQDRIHRSESQIIRLMQRLMRSALGIRPRK